MKPLIVTSGDPAGIGPEIVLKAVRQWQDMGPNQRPLLVAGDPEWFQSLSEEIEVPTKNIRFLPVEWKKDAISLGRVGKEAGQAGFESIRAAVSLCMKQEAGGIVTAPIHKESLALAGHPPALVRGAGGGDQRVVDLIARTRDALVPRWLDAAGRDDASPLTRLALRGWLVGMEETVIAWDPRSVRREELVDHLTASFLAELELAEGRV